MTSEYMKFEVGKMSVEVNWDKDVKPCKKIKFTFGGVEEIVEHADLYSLLIMFGDDKIQDAVIPTTKVQLRVIERLLHVRVKKDMKEGDVINFPYRYAIPEDVYNRLLVEDPINYKPVRLSTEVADKPKV